MIVGALASWAVNVLFHWDSLPFYLVHILVWFLSDWILLSIVQVSSLKIQFELQINQRIIHFPFRMGRYHSTNLTLCVAGCLESSQDHIYS